jgi:hypothetical protein
MVFGACQYEKDIGAYLSSEWDIITDEGSLLTQTLMRHADARMTMNTPRWRRHGDRRADWRKCSRCRCGAASATARRRRPGNLPNNQPNEATANDP